jgi:CBS domain-containing protein
VAWCLLEPIAGVPTAELIMRRRAITCRADDPMDDAARAMWEHDVGMLPVLDADGRVIAAITDRGIAMAACIQGKPLSAMSVEAAMSKRIFTARPTTPIVEIERIMAEEQVRRIPIVDDDGRALGIISLDDLAQQSMASEGAWIAATQVAATLRAICRPRRTR